MAIWAPLTEFANAIHQRICPLYTFTDRGKVQVMGSAVPFRTAEVSLLLTAAHVCFEKYSGPPPLFTWGRDRPRALLGRRGACEYRPRQMPDVDLAVIELSDEDADDLSSTYRFTTSDEITTAQPKTPGVHYLIAGYPASKNRATSDSLPSVATYFITGDIGGVKNLYRTDKAEEYHFTLSVPKRGVPKMGGGVFQLPVPAGMSGGGIWRLEIDVARGLATSPLLVGIGIESHKERRLFVGTRVQAAMPLVGDLIAKRLGPAT